jgi:hypothetical protein
MNLEKLHENVYYYRNAIADPAALIELINSTEGEEGISKVVPSWDHWEACSGECYIYGEKKNLNIENMLEINNDESKEKAQKIIDIIVNSMTDVCKDFAKDKGVTEKVNLSPYIGINKYKPGTFMGGHYDQQEGDLRLKYSLVAYLNDDYEGGEISFTIKEGILGEEDRPREDIDHEMNKEKVTFYLKPEAGSILIFPSSPPYNHTAHLVKSGYKYMVPGFWMNEEK